MSEDRGNGIMPGTTLNPSVPKVRWDAANMKSSYANVCNVTSTREEVVLLFGMNEAWQNGQKEVTVHLTDRIILNPFAARRLVGLMNNLLREYESRFGVLPADPVLSQETARQR